ncbi:MAG: neuraminidase-like domain-containing protein [Calothrix sp. MO_167.B12]|nr:neuraminidase-like domain-containing protein [Calothrix sp. MO_167.B12]
MSDLTHFKSDNIIKDFIDKNREFDLLSLQSFNFFDEAAVNSLNWEDLERENICIRLKAYQRLLNLGLNGEQAKKHLEASTTNSNTDFPKLDSACAIASLSEEEYVKYVQAFSITPEKAREVHRKATEKNAGLMMLLAEGVEVCSPRCETMLADNTAPIRQQLRSLPSYQKLFGSLDFLQCDPCQSIFSPSAYFVDLMRICKSHISEPNNMGNSGFESLDQRRPDLKKIELTCDNTNDTVPYTQIVNDVLVEKLKQVLCKEENPSEQEKEKLRNCREDKDVYQHLATAKYPHNVPFNLYLEQIWTYLGHLKTNLADIYQVIHPEKGKDKIWSQAFLKLSPEEYKLITTTDSSTGDLSLRYGVNVLENDFGGLIKRETFLKQIGLSWQQLNELLYQNLSQDEIKAGDAHQFFINKKLQENKYLHLNDRGEIKIKKPDSEAEEYLNLDTLDRVDRFLRLPHKLNWSFTDLDWVLTSIKADDINEDAITKIAKIKQLQDQTKLPLDVLCSFWHDMKAIGKGDNEKRPQDLFNRIFNNPLTLQGKDRWKPNIHPNETEENKQNKQNTQSLRLGRERLIGALQLSDRQLTEIVEEIWENPPKITLNLTNLSKLFRIAQIIKLLGFKVDEYKLLLKLLNKSRESSEEIKFDQLEIDQLIEIIEFAEWLKTARFSVYELDYILNGTEYPSVEVFLPEEKMAVLMESLWQTEWQLSPEDYKLITTKNDTEKSLSYRYGVDVSEYNLGGLTYKSTFLKQTKLSEQELTELLYQNLSDDDIKSGKAHQFFINQKLPNNGYIHLTKACCIQLCTLALLRGTETLAISLLWVMLLQKLENLNLETLDRVDRFLRLARKTGWSFADLDWVLDKICAKDIDKKSIRKITKIKQYQEQIKFQIKELRANESFHSIEKINPEFNEKLAHHFGIAPRLFSVLAQLALQAKGEKDYISFLLTQFKTEAGDWEEIVDCLKSISKWHLLVSKLALTETELSNIRTYPKIYNIESLLNLTVQNIQNLYNFKNQLVRVFNGSEEYLVDFPESSAQTGYWPLDEGQGNKISDKAGDNDGTLKGNANWQTATDFPGTVFRKVLQFDGSSNYVQLTDASTLGLTNSGFTVEAWVKADDLSWSGYENDQPVLGMDNYDHNPDIGRNKTLHLIIRDKKAYLGFAHDDLHGKNPLESGKWYQIVYLYDIGQKLQAIFINGKLDKPDAQMGPFIGTDVVNIGRWNNSVYFKGQIANVRIWKQRLSDDQIIALYNSATVQSLLQIKQRVDLSRKLGCSIDFLEELCNLLENSSAQNNWDKYQQLAQTIISLTKAKYDDEEWTKVFEKLNGTIEERKTKILTDFALWKLRKENPRQLSEYLLLDVEMTSCACNSRIQLGILSLQTYLQRCRMGLEAGVTKVEIPEVWWEWIMNYRKWEANRKVFLYPENYIDPTLRKDASPLFKELQDELLQSEITADTVETAYRHYFDKLAEISNLQIVEGCRYDVQTPKSNEAIDTLFLFAKTVSQPHTFYYRRCEHPTAEKPSWGHWEKIDLQINSDYLSSVYAFNRLFVFWVETKELQKPDKKDKKELQKPDKKDKKEDGGVDTSKTKEITEATIKYSFLNTSQKWVSPQTHDEDVEIPHTQVSIDSEAVKIFYRRVTPVVLAKSNPQSNLIIAILGGLQNILSSHYKNTGELLVTFQNHVLGGRLFPKSRISIASDLLPASIDNDITTEMKISLSYLPSDLEIPNNTTVTPIKNQSQGFILQNRSKAFSYLGQKPVSRLTTNAIQQFSQTLFAKGIDGLLSLESQLIPEPEFRPFVNQSNSLDFDGAYGAYFWEIFFHIPFLIASTLNAHQRYNEARKWYQYIFNPTKPSPLHPIANLPLNEGGGATKVVEQETKTEHSINGTPDWEQNTNFPEDSSRNVLRFDGKNTFIDIGTLNFTAKSSLTVEVWVKPQGLPVKVNQPTNAAAILGMISGGLGSERNKRLTLEINSANKVNFTFNGGKHGLDFPPGVIGDEELKNDKWYCIVGRYNFSTKEQAIFINGKLDAVKKNVEPFAENEDSIYIGFTHSRGYNYFQGHIANLRIWNVALSDALIKERFKNPNAEVVTYSYWHFLPFQYRTPKGLLDTLQNTQAIQAYKENPFDPHAIARLRVGAYEKAVVMKYIDNLLDWGDALFTEDNWESIAQATTLYMLAYELLGEKPKNRGKLPARDAKTFAKINQSEGNISDFLIDLETCPEYKEFLNQKFGNDIPFNAVDAYFCVSENQEFAQYWDRVEDRLFKIRHCQNIQGIERQLALFSPPIDPRQLVRQAAAGDGTLSLSTTDIVPHYRFSYLLERAKGMVSTVIQLGSTLLSTLEKKDAEELALLRATQEPVLLQLITKTKEKQIEEAEVNLESLKKSLASASDRQAHYQNLIVGGWNAGERDTVQHMNTALDLQKVTTGIRTASVAAYLLPSIYGMSNGGMKFGEAASMAATVLDSFAGIYSQEASLASTIAQFQRRQEDWELQHKMADWDIQQIEEQIKAAQVRIEMAKAELDVHNKSMEHSREIEQFLKDKFTNKELYQWMVGRLSGLYFQTYKIALDMANSAQKAYQYELNKDDTYIQPTHWDSQKKGLLAGESLMLGLNHLEKAYLDGNERDLEIEKIISLRQIDPLAFLNLIKYGKCLFSFDEKLFDFDFPGHYCRQIKTISVSIPAVVGPYQNINATLKQTSDKVLVEPNKNAVEWLLTNSDKNAAIPMNYTKSIRQGWRNNQQIALSKGTDDNGMFVLNFQDERYLPFEGTGAVSTWELSLPKAANRIDFDTISDVIITLSYTALDGGDKFREEVTNLEPLKQYSEAYYFNLKQLFTGEWHTFLNLNKNTKSQELKFKISEDIIPPHIKEAKLTGIIFKLDTPDVSSPMSFDTITIGGNNIINENDNSINQSVANNWFGDWVINFDLTKVPKNLKKDGSLNPEIVNNIELILIYEINIKSGI